MYEIQYKILKLLNAKDKIFPTQEYVTSEQISEALGLSAEDVKMYSENLENAELIRIQLGFMVNILSEGKLALLEIDAALEAQGEEDRPSMGFQIHSQGSK